MLNESFILLIQNEGKMVNVQIRVLLQLLAKDSGALHNARGGGGSPRPWGACTVMACHPAMQVNRCPI